MLKRDQLNFSFLPYATCVAVASIFVCAFTPAPAHAALGDPCRKLLVPPPLVKNPQFSNPPRIVTTYFTGNGRFDQSLSIERLKVSGQAYTVGNIKHQTRVGYGLDELVIGEAQDFSLAAMVTTNYVTLQQAMMFKRIGPRLEPGQFLIAEAIRDASPLEIKQNYGIDMDARRGGMHTIFDYDSSLIPVKTAALWSFAGQIWDQQTGDMRYLRLPWEMEEARQGQGLDRSKYPIVFEWGRAAQEVSGEIHPLYSLMALQNYLQVIAANKNLNDAYVMVHSLDPTHTKLYARMTKSGYYPDGKPENPEDQLFITPLKHALETHPPSRISQRVADLIELSDRTISELDLVRLLVETRLSRWSELDYQKHGRTQEFPILVNDLSMARPHTLAKIIEVLPTSHQNKQAILDKLATLDGEMTLFATTVDGKYDNAGDSVSSSYVYQDRNAVEISNLDVKMAVHDPEYAKSVLYGAYMFETERIADVLHRYHGIPWEQALIAASDLIHDLKIEFGITTHVPLIQQQLKKLQPSEQILLPKIQILGGGPPSEHDLKKYPRRHRDAQMYFFTAEQIVRMGYDDRSFAIGNRHALRPGKWRSEYIQSQLDIF